MDVSVDISSHPGPPIIASDELESLGLSGVSGETSVVVGFQEVLSQLLVAGDIQTFLPCYYTILLLPILVLLI